MPVQLISESALTPRYSHNKSYYGKAVVKRYTMANGEPAAVLESYTSPVIMVTESGKVYKTRLADYSATTRKHVYDFLMQTDHDDLSSLKALREKIPEVTDFKSVMDA